MTTFSELKQWKKVETIGRRLRSETGPYVQSLGSELMALSLEMQTQLTRGIHENPSLIVYGNPRSGKHKKNPPGRVKAGRALPAGEAIKVKVQLASDLHEIRYTHAKNNDDFRHPFEGGVEVWAIERAGQREFLVTHPEGKPLWDLFED